MTALPVEPGDCYPHAMFFVFGKKSKVRPVPGGRREKRKCPGCGKTAFFTECIKESKVTAYHVVELWDDEEKVFVCDSCSEAMDFEDTHPPELSEKERAKLARGVAKERARVAKAAEKQRVKQAREIETELAALKKRLGKD